MKKTLNAAAVVTDILVNLMELAFLGAVGYGVYLYVTHHHIVIF